MASSEQSARLDQWRRTARGVGVVAVVFSLVVGVLLTADWLRAGQAKTVRSDELSRVLATARQAPDSGTVALAREMDQVARHAYFSSVTFRNTGIWMLIAGALAAVACLHAAARLGRRIDDPRRFPAADQARADQKARVAMLATGGVGLLSLMVWACCFAPVAPTAAPPHGLPAVARTNPPPVAPVAVPVAVAPPMTNAPAFQWSCFRGPRCGVSGWTNAPTAWDGRTGAGVRWRTSLGKPGVSSPVIWGRKLFLTMADEHAREVRAFDTESGAESSPFDLPG